MEIPRLTPEEVKRRLDEGEAILFVDVRSRAAYEKSHIQEAVSLPVKEAEDRYWELPLNRTILCY